MVNHRKVVSNILMSLAVALLLFSSSKISGENGKLKADLALADSLYRETIGEAEEAQMSIDRLTSELRECQSSDELNEKNVKQYIKWLRLKHPDVIWAMIRQESSLKSDLVRTNNNIIGMKHPGERVNVSLGTKNGYAYYSDWKMCLIDVALWQARYINHKKFTREQFLDYLQNNYATDSKYKQHLKSHL